MKKYETYEVLGYEQYGEIYPIGKCDGLRCVGDSSACGSYYGVDKGIKDADGREYKVIKCIDPQYLK